MTLNTRSARLRYVHWALALLAAGALRLSAAFGADADTTQNMTSVDELRAGAEAAVLELASQSGLKIRAQAAALDPRLRLQRCAAPPQTTVNTDWQNQETTTVRVACAAPVRWSIYVRVALQSTRTVLIAKRNLPRGSVLAPDDFESRLTTVSGPVAHYISDVSQLTGLRLRLPLAVGVALSSDVVEQAPLIRRGQQVTLLARSGGIEIRVAAIAMSDGRQSERITVQNLSTRRAVDAVVRSGELVEVGL
jgi:flagella basal body P-ring formation protein FlgA